MKQIAIYGKGGIGKSTVASNLSMALSAAGHRVMQVGCDPKRDSTRTLTGGRLIPTVLETFRERLRLGKDEYSITLEEIVHHGQGAASGILCVEAGGPEPGIGCAGRGVMTAIDILRNLKAFEVYALDVVVYDVLGDVVCGGFAQPIRAGFARDIYLVCSGEFMSIYAANNIAKAIARLSQQGGSALAGIIANSRGKPDFEKAVLTEFARRLGTELAGFIPRSDEILAAEAEGRTVMERAPQCAAALAFVDLARRIVSAASGAPNATGSGAAAPGAAGLEPSTRRAAPSPLELEDLEALYRDALYAARRPGA